MHRFIEELKERGVLRAAGLYIALTWLLLQIADVVFPAFDIPDTTLRYILFGAIGGFPIAMLVSWFYDISSDGIRSEDDIRETGGRRNRGVISSMTLVFLVLALGASLYGNFKQANDADAGPPELASILMTDFINGTGDESFNGALQPTLIAGIERAPFIDVFSRNSAQLVTDDFNSSRPLDEETALQIALREGMQLVIAGDIQADGSAYAVSIRAINPQDREIVFETDITADSRAELLPAVAELALLIREELGDTLSEEPEADNGAILVGASLPAARFYAAAQAYSSNGQNEKAIEDYASAIAADPDFGMANLGWALSLQQLGQFEESQLQWQETLAKLDGMSERQRYRTLGLHAAHAQADYDKAIESYAALLANYPAEVVGRSELAGVYFNAHHFDKALEQIAILHKRYPSNLAYQARYARYAMYAGEFDIARQQAEKHLKSDSEYFLSYLPLAMAYLAQGDVAVADKTYQLMAEAGPAARSLAHTGQADIALLQGDYAAAIALLDASQAADMESGDSSAAAHKAVYRAIALHGLGDNMAAQRLIEEILPAIENPSDLLIAGQLLVALGELEKAKSVAAKLNTQGRVSGLAQADLLAGAIAVAEGRFVAAVDLLVASIAETDSWPARFALGQAYVLAGYQAEALGEFKQCEDRLGEVTALFLDDIPTFQYSAPLYYWLAKTKQQLGMSKEAATDYQRYLALRVATDESALTIDARTRLGEVSSR